MTSLSSRSVHRKTVYHLLPAELRRHPGDEPRPAWHARVEAARREREAKRCLAGGFDALAPDDVGLSLLSLGALHRLLSWSRPDRAFCAGTYELCAALGASPPDATAAVEELGAAGYLDITARGHGRGKNRTLWTIRIVPAAEVSAARARRVTQERPQRPPLGSPVPCPPRQERAPQAPQERRGEPRQPSPCETERPRRLSSDVGPPSQYAEWVPPDDTRRESLSEFLARMPHFEGSVADVRRLPAPPPPLEGDALELAKARAKAGHVAA